MMTAATTKPQPMFRPTGLGAVGEGLHRSGWPYALQALQPWLAEDAPVLLDDFVERTFLFGKNRKRGIVHRSPWIGIFHHPVDVPEGFGIGPDGLGQLPAWRESLPHLKLAIVLAGHMAPWVRQAWGKPCLVLRHPSEAPALTWSPAAFDANPAKKLVQVGFFLRNTHAICQVPAPAWLEKVRLNPSAGFIRRLHQHWKAASAHRPDVGAVTELERLGDGAYDRLLSRNLVFLELLEASANNTILECIARATPIVVNRLPGPEFYLGRDYPLFYDHLGEVAALLTPERILEAHAYLRRLPKDWLSGQAFARDLAEGCRRMVPELWAPR